MKKYYKLGEQGASDVLSSTVPARELAMKYGVSYEAIRRLRPGRFFFKQVRIKHEPSFLFAAKKHGTRVKSDHFCDCGCGEFTYVSMCTRPKLNLVRGQPCRYLKGHAARVTHKQPKYPPEIRAEIAKASGSCEHVGRQYGISRSTVLSYRKETENAK